MTTPGPGIDTVTARMGFVVIGRNEGDRLIRCLEALRRLRTCEIVYVDSGSTDQSIAEAEKRGVHVVPLDMTRPFTAGRARNEGFAALQERAPELQYVQFVDGDCELVQGWLEAALAFLESRKDVAVVCGRRKERDPGASIYNRLCDIEWNTPVGEADACGGDALFRVSAFNALGGFSGSLIAGEEPELCSRLRAGGWKIWRLDADMTLHDAAMYRFSQWWMRGLRSGFGYAQVWQATRASHVPLYAKELLRALVWAGAIPLAIIAMALLYPILGLFALGVYLLQILRIALRRGARNFDSWAYGCFTLLAKFPELLGAARFFLQTRRGRASHAILYK